MSNVVPTGGTGRGPADSAPYSLEDRAQPPTRPGHAGAVVASAS